MSDELRDLYQEVILDHNKSPRNFGKLEGHTHTAEGYNPLCGDSITLYVHKEGELLKDIRFVGSGCAISRASASLMTSTLKGKSPQDAKTLFEAFRKVITTDPNQAVDTAPLGKLAALAGVREFPARVKCASLAWHTLNAALEGRKDPVSTETEEASAGTPGPISPEDAQALGVKVVEALRTCFDPEIPVNIYDLGLIYDVAVSPAGEARVKMTLTSPNCPVAGSLPMEVQTKVGMVEGVAKANVDLVWDPPWNPSKMSEAAKLELGMM